MDFLYDGKDARDRAIFEGLDYCGPDRFVNGEWHLVARVPKLPPDSDGQNVELYECRMPARFFKLVALPTPNSMGETTPGWSLSTGSGDEVGRILVEVAKQVCEGMIGWHPLEEKK